MNVCSGVALGSFDPASNKKVGCIIVKNGEIIGSGNRQVYMVNVSPYKDLCIHAEHLALIKAEHMSRGATLYCTLEPCRDRVVSDVNILPPPDCCCDLIVKAGIKRVVYRKDDSYIGHGGREYLESKGITVEQI